MNDHIITLLSLHKTSKHVLCLILVKQCHVTMQLDINLQYVTLSVPNQVFVIVIVFT